MVRVPCHDALNIDLAPRGSKVFDTLGRARSTRFVDESPQRNGALLESATRKGDCVVHESFHDPSLSSRRYRVTPSLSLRTAFFCSGTAGLVYEVLWSRYLGLYVGHSAYAQVLVLTVYLGGMAVGSMAVADVSKRLPNPLRWYVGAELALALFGLAFHTVFVAATNWSYDSVFPAIADASWVGSIRWALAGALILPQAIVLGMTFPLMAAGLVREDPTHPGARVAEAYTLNTLGGALGVLLAGFVFIGAFGLPGTSAAAALLNVLAAGLVIVALSRQPSASGDPVDPHGTSIPPLPTHVDLPTEVISGDKRLVPLLLVVSFGTAVASFAYEIGWIRMLSLVLGSATHAFELMLSAFILGIAIGAWAVRTRSDRTRTPIRLLGGIQVAMGIAALVSLPIYLLSFDAVAGMVQSLSGKPDGYAIFNMGRYALSMVVMLPSTILAGTTLPLITGTLLRSGRGEQVIGRIYAVNTLGSVFGAGLAGLIALPLLGLEGLITAGAMLDVTLGLVLLERSGVWRGAGRRTPLTVGAVAIVGFLTVGAAVDFNPNTITSGVFRRGDFEGHTAWRNLFYQDGRTSTVSAHIGASDGVVVLATNGKPDATLGPRWIGERADSLDILPIPEGRDFTTQTLGPILALAHRPKAQTAAIIGHGSGMSATSLLTSERIERLVTIEIEPLMVQGSLVFLPANGPAFADPRASYVFDDAKSYFAHRREPFDLIFAEPSNPWVSGTASLFTLEFYQRIQDFLSKGGVLCQWLQIYELDDDLFLSVLAALDQVFPYYRAYLVGDADVAIVASLEPLGSADWSVVQTESFQAMTSGAPTFEPQHMDALLMFDQDTFRPVLERAPPVNSDYHPILDLGAEQTRFDQRGAEGVFSFAISRVNLASHVSGERLAPRPYRLVPAYGLTPAVLQELGAWLRGTLADRGGIAPIEFPEWQDELVHLQQFLTFTRSPVQLTTWDTWSASFVRAETALHRGTTGHVDPIFYRNVRGFLDRADAPEPARAAVDLLHGYSTSDWERTAAAADILVGPVARGEPWVTPDLLLDIAVLAYLETGRAQAASSAYQALARTTGRADWNLRNRLLHAMIDDALEAG